MSGLMAVLPCWWSWPEVRGFSAVLSGTLLGMIIHPYFPQNLKFYQSQLIDIGVVNYQKVIGVGGEWYPYGFVELIPDTFMVVILAIITLTVMFIFYQKQSALSLTSLAYFVFFLLLTLKSRRYVEYYVPFA